MPTEPTPMSFRTDPVVEIRQLQKSFKTANQSAIKSLTVAIHPGKVTGLV